MSQGFRLQKSLPKVGIRPTIDGRRRGVRESLEDQTMGMAKRAAELIESSLRHASGEKVECVIADTTIGGVSEAAACEEKFQREGVGVSFLVKPKTLFRIKPIWIFTTSLEYPNWWRP